VRQNKRSSIMVRKAIDTSTASSPCIALRPSASYVTRSTRARAVSDFVSAGAVYDKTFTRGSFKIARRDAEVSLIRRSAADSMTPQAKRSEVFAMLAGRLPS
jgi:hypothetical protein